jgi:IS30 family transposase
MHVSHETIYLTLFIQARGGLKRELTRHLRTRRANRRPHGKTSPSGKGQIVDPVMISEPKPVSEVIGCVGLKRLP